MSLGLPLVARCGTTHLLIHSMKCSTVALTHVGGSLSCDTPKECELNVMVTLDVFTHLLGIPNKVKESFNQFHFVLQPPKPQVIPHLSRTKSGFFFFEGGGVSGYLFIY